MFKTNNMNYLDITTNTVSIVDCGQLQAYSITDWGMVGEDRGSVFERSTQCLQNMSYELISLSDRDLFAQSLNAKTLSLLENTPAAP